MPRKDSTSGFRGVSWHKSAQKWGAYIRRDGLRHFLGLFDSAEEAHAAYLDAHLRLEVSRPDPRTELLERVMALYEEHGPKALASPFLTAVGIAPKRLRGVGLKHAELLDALNLAREYEQWRSTTFRYAGQTKPRWTWEHAIATARELIARENDLPTVEWCRRNGFGQLTTFVHKSGHTWEDLRAAVGLRPSQSFFDSRSGIRWRSRPEACLSNFLYARGIKHRRGDRYPNSYAEQFGRVYGRYDMHFIDAAGAQIDIEIWGDIPDAYSCGRYARTRAMKEAFHNGRPNFLGIHYLDCQSDARLSVLLEPFIGVIAPSNFDKPEDHWIETAHWTDADELLESCRRVAEQMPDGIFPNEQWLRKRGRYADRPGETYNTLSIYVTKWLGGTRNVRKLLGQEHASTTSWTPETVIDAWRKFEADHDLTPAQCKGAYRRNIVDKQTRRLGARIYEVARRLGVVEQARNGRTGRKCKWTPERAISEWREFDRKHGLSPSQAMGLIQRKRLTHEVANEGARIYNAALRLGVVARAKGLR